MTKQEALATFLNVDESSVVQGNRENRYAKRLFLVNDIAYAVFSERESFAEVFAYFDEDISTYHFKVPYLAKVLGISEESLRNDVTLDYDAQTDDIQGNDALRKLIDETCGLLQIVRDSVQGNGYGYYINQFDHTQSVCGNYLIYRWH